MSEPTPNPRRSDPPRGFVHVLADRAKRVSRVLAYFSVVSLGIGLVAASHAWGDVERMSLAVGDELGRLAAGGREQQVRVNAQPIRIATSTEDAPIEAVLDAFEGYCKARTAGLDATLANLPEASRAVISAPARAGALGVMRTREGDKGAVACVVRPEGAGEGDLSDLVARVGELAKTGDLASLGQLRYLHARRTKQGKTHVVLAWSEGSFRVGAMFPREGDAPGSDPIVAPRPPASTRFFSASVDGAPYGVRLYDATTDPDATMAAYDALLTERGYRLLVRDPNDANARAYARPEGDLWVTIAPASGREGASQSLVSLVEIPASR